MDPQVSGSFIPKKPLVEVRRRGGGMGLVLLACVLLLVLSLAAAAGVFAYQNYLNFQIASKSKSLTLAEGAFEPNVIEDLSRLDSRITHTQQLLQKHTAPSAIFDYLSTITLAKVQFTSFDFKTDDSGSATVALQGVGDSFSTVALQSDQFGSSRLLKDVVFSDVAIAQGGTVTFSVTATLDPSLYLFAREGSATSATPNAPPMGSSTPAQ